MAKWTFEPAPKSVLLTSALYCLSGDKKILKRDLDRIGRTRTRRKRFLEAKCNLNIEEKAIVIANNIMESHEFLRSLKKRIR